jgi:hypothetical protein
VGHFRLFIHSSVFLFQEYNLPVMAPGKTSLQIFIASPGDVQAERERLKKVVGELNIDVAASRSLVLEPITWQTHTHPGMGKDPQDVINKQIKPTDIFIGIMWKRFGTPTERAPSGTVEEFQSACKRWEKNRQTQIMFYFNQSPVPMNEDMREVQKVKDFRELIGKSGLIADYTGADDFEAQVRSHLTKLVLEWNATPDAIEAKAPASATSSTRKGVWPPPPNRPTVFVGREDGLKALRQRLVLSKNDRARGKTPTIAMYGMGGVGKTTLAAELTWDEQIKKAFPDGILWATVGETSERALLGRWGARLGKDGEKIAGAISAETARTELGNVLRDRRMLLVVDDVWKPKQAVEFKKILGTGCALLITTRLRGLALDRAVVDQPEKQAYQLPKLTVEASLELLEELAPSVVKKYRQKCRALAKALEGLPLALQIAGHLLVDEYQKDPELAEKLLDELIAGKKLLPTVNALLKRSTDRLDTTTRERFAALGPSSSPAIFSPTALKLLWHVDDPQPTINALVDRSLLQALGNGKFQMHAVLLSFAKSLRKTRAKSMKAGR